ncbi:MAG: MFS transporter [Gammaproteobacteria bacterium]|nr:MFS transporter [Gammaproteobacteria bacterium]
MSLEKMNPEERRAVGSLATIMSLRLIGLFMILPVFALYAHDLPGATPFLIGLAMGVYGLTQGLFQIPFGMLSDHIGRKPVIVMGLLIFAIGSVIAAMSHSIYGMLIGRALQGAGAVGSTIIAMIADLTRENQRTKAMAINGMTIGLSFSLAMILGPILASWIQVSGIFWLAVLFSFMGIVLLLSAVPTPAHSTWHSDAEPEPAQFLTLLKEPELTRLNIGVFLLHAIFTASFVVIPISLQQYAGLPGAHQWYLYVPALVLAFIFSILFIIRAEKKRHVKYYFLLGIVMLGASGLVLCFFAGSLLLSACGLLLFFTGFSLLEAFLPSWVSRAAPKARKGTALGIYSCSQFLGIFVGGSLGGWLYGTFGLLHVYLFCVLFALIWLAVALGMNNPSTKTH